jgi:hypothetical protein
MQWVQDPTRSNIDNVNNVRRVASRQFRNKQKACMKAKNEELETNSKIKKNRDLYRGINDFMKGYQPRTNIVKDEKGYLVADCHSILFRCRNHFSKLLNNFALIMLGRHIHTAEPLEPGQVPLRLSWLLKR